MPFAFNAISPTTIGTIDKWDIPINDWLDVKFGSGRDSTLGNAVSRFTEDTIYDSGPTMRPDVANKQFGIPGHLVFTDPVTIGRASLLRKRKEMELEQQAYLESASHGSFSPKAFAGFFSQMAGGMSHPLDAGLMFLPFVGSEKAVAGMARYGFGPNRAAFNSILARGLVTEESIAASRILFPKLSSAMIEGVLSQAAVEAPIAIQKFRDQADYGPEDVAADVLGGGLFAGGIHLAGTAIKNLWGKTSWAKAKEFHDRLTPETHDAIAKEVGDALMEGRTPDIAKFINIDENVIREKLRFDEAAARAEAESMVPKTEAPHQASANELLDLAQAESQRGTQAGKILGRLLDRFIGGERTPQVLEQIAALTNRVYDPSYTSPQESLHIENVFGAREKALKPVNDRIKSARADLYRIDQVLPDLLKRLHSAEGNEARQLRSNISNLQNQRAEIVQAIEKFGDRVEAPKPLSPEEKLLHANEFSDRPDIASKMQAERQAQIQSLVDKAKAEHAATLEGKVSEAVAQERARQIAEGRIVDPVTVKERATREVPDESEISKVNEDSAALEQDYLNRLSEEDQAAAREELAALQDEIYKDEGKALKKALPCVGKGL